MGIIKLITKHFEKEGYSGYFLKLRINEYIKSTKKSLTIIMIFCILLFGGITLMFQLNYEEKIGNKIFTPYANKISSVYEDHTIIKGIAQVCSQFEKEENQLKCVNNFVKEFFYYDDHTNESKTFRTPREIINTGGCCRDYSVLYSSIFTLMGYEYSFMYEPNHVYVKIYGEKNDYILDQKHMEILK